MEGGWNGTLGLAVRHDRVDQYREHQDTGNHADPEDQHVQIEDRLAGGGDALPEVEGPIGGAGRTHAEHEGCA
jgi:hypothetical protein